MFAITETWEVGTDNHTVNTDKYVFLMLLKLGLDIIMYLFCTRKPFVSFMSMCSLSLVLADWVMVLTLAVMWYLGPDKTPVPLCLLLAIASTTYDALPLAVTFLGLLDYCLRDTCCHKHFASWKKTIDLLLTLLVWMTALVYAYHFVKAETVELDVSTRHALACEVKESTVVTCFLLITFTVVLGATMPYLSSIPQWLEEADQLSKMREEKDNQPSDFLVIYSKHTEAEFSEGDKKKPDRPPLWLSLMLAFAVFWMPYLSTSTICLLLGLRAPTYITINVLWLECTNSLLTGVVFWANSDRQGPYCNLPENVCLWQVFWYLSGGTWKQQRPKAVFNPSKAKRETLLYV